MHASAGCSNEWHTTLHGSADVLTAANSTFSSIPSSSGDDFDQQPSVCMMTPKRGYQGLINPSWSAFDARTSSDVASAWKIAGNHRIASTFQFGLCYLFVASYNFLNVVMAAVVVTGLAGAGVGTLQQSWSLTRT